MEIIYVSNCLKVSTSFEFKIEENFKNSRQTRQTAQEQRAYELELKDHY
jgi:hypothetical protein